MASFSVPLPGGIILCAEELANSVPVAIADCHCKAHISLAILQTSLALVRILTVTLGSRGSDGHALFSKGKRSFSYSLQIQLQFLVSNWDAVSVNLLEDALPCAIPT